MSEHKDPSATILRDTVTVTLYDEDGEPHIVPIKTFSFAKTLKVFSIIGELFSVVDIGKAVTAANADAAEGVFEENSPAPVATNFISQVLDLLPKALIEGVPSVYRLIGLLPLTNRELKALEKGDTDLGQTLLVRGQDLASDNGIDAIMELVTASIQVIGVETLVRSVGPLVRMLRANVG